MPVVAVVNSKGGVGKTTASLLLGTVLAEQAATVSIIDADPNRHLVACGGVNECKTKLLSGSPQRAAVNTVRARYQSSR